MSHTPGPWTTDGPWVDTRPHEAGDMRYSFAAPGEDGTEEQEANAALISAAPDLLTLCKAINDDLRYAEWPSPEAAEEWIGNFTRAYAKSLRAAIAKATEVPA
jgi:hypothetical protein